MMKFDNPLFLRRILQVDAIVSGAMGLLMAFGAATLGEWLALPAALLRYAGFSLFPFAAMVGSLARQEAAPRSGVLAVVGMNAAWVAASILLLLSGTIHPTGLGYAFVAGQAAAVALLAELQYAGVRRTPALATARSHS